MRLDGLKDAPDGRSTYSTTESAEHSPAPPKGKKARLKRSAKLTNGLKAN